MRSWSLALVVSVSISAGCSASLGNGDTAGKADGISCAVPGLAHQRVFPSLSR